MKLNKAEKFVKAQTDLGKTFNGVRLAVFEKLLTWNFPPEYKDALISAFPTLSYEIKGYNPLDDCPFCEKEDCGCEDILDLPLPERDCFVCPKGGCKCENIHLSPLPHQESKEWEDMIGFMRADLESNMAYSKIIDIGIFLVEKSGRNFQEEFEKWKKTRTK